MDADFFRAWIAEIAVVVEAQRDHLTQLDSAIGDAELVIHFSQIILYYLLGRAHANRNFFVLHSLSDAGNNE